MRNDAGTVPKFLVGRPVLKDLARHPEGTRDKADDKLGEGPGGVLLVLLFLVLTIRDACDVHGGPKSRRKFHISAQN